MKADPQKIFDRAQAFERAMRAAQAELAKSIVTGRSADGSVTILATGLGKLRAVQVDPAVFDRRDVEGLQDAIAQAVQAAAAHAGRLAEQKMGPIELSLH